MNVELLKKDFPVLNQQMNEFPLIYLDNGNTTQKPSSVIKAITDFYSRDNSNIYRSSHTLGERATQQFEDSRNVLQHWIHAEHRHEIIFTKGATEGINLVASCFGQMGINSHESIIISAVEHHSNIVPWQHLCESTGAQLNVIPVDDQGELDLESYEKFLFMRPKIVAITHVSHVLGTINPIKKMVQMAHQAGVPVLVDGSQAIPHLPIDVKDLDCDFYIFSGHKMYGPTGIGVLYGKTCWLEKMPPYQHGGNMIKHVSYAKAEYHELPFKFEAGTAPIAAVIALKAAVEYLKKIDINHLINHEKELFNFAKQGLREIPGVSLLVDNANGTAIISFVIKNFEPQFVASFLNQHGIAVRVGYNCAMPLLMERFVTKGIIRISCGLYNDLNDINVLNKYLLKLTNNN